MRTRVIFAATFFAASARAQNDIEDVHVRATEWASPRSAFDVVVKRDVLDASPRQQASELLSAVPGFFVDHEDGEGLANDVKVRGFDVDHGAGVEMRLGFLPISSPIHVLASGYADANIVIPEVVRRLRVSEGSYDPRQGDGATFGTATFDLGAPRRGVGLRASYGSFDQVRVLGIAGPRGADEDTFAAFQVRRTGGFGENRAGESGTVNAQYGVDLGAWDRVRVIAAAYAARSRLAGVVRADDVAAGRVGFYDSYPGLGDGQYVQTARVLAGASFEHETRRGGRFDVTPWVSWSDLRLRRNFTGALVDPRGDLLDSKNAETAAGLESRFHAAPARIGDDAALAIEPGVSLRAGHVDEARALPSTPLLDAGASTFDAAGFIDADLRLFRKLRISGGVRADVLAVAIDDRLASSRSTAGAFVGPRATIAWDMTRGVSVSASYGEGFRSRPIDRLADGATPFSRVRSAELGLRAHDEKKRFEAALALFDTFADDELVFDPTQGAYETEWASSRRGLVASIVARPFSWLLASTALTVTNAIFTASGPDVPRFVPNVAPIVFRADVSVRRRIGPVTAHAGVGYTFVARSHLTDDVIGDDVHALNATAGIRWSRFEASVDAYNLLALRYADDEAVYVSRWSKDATPAKHISAAPPATVIGSVAIWF